MDWTTAVTDADELRSVFAGRPDAKFRPFTAWWWSGEPVTEERLRWQAEQMAALGCGGYVPTGLCLHGPAGGSPADDPLGGSDEWYANFRIAADVAREHGMGLGVWNPWQFGAPVDSKPLLTARPDLRGELVHTRDGVRVDPFGFDFASRSALDALTGPGTAARRFLDEIEDLYGDPVVAMFEDEWPAFPRWSPTFADEFRALKGYDPPVAAFDTDLGPATPKYRWDLFDVACTRAERSYTETIGQWVRERNLLAGYDQMGRGGAPVLTSAYYFDPFRTMRWANAPGTDQMGDARFELSINDLQGGTRVWLEGFHSHGWGMRLSDQARLLWEWGREGASLFLPHGMYYSGRALWWEWAPPEQGWKQPYARHYPHFADAVGRLMAATSAGRHEPEVVVLYPTSTMWAGTDGHLRWSEEAQHASRTYLAVFGFHAVPSGWELERWAHPSVLAEAGYDRGVVDEANVSRFDVPVVVPGCTVLRTATLEALVADAERGRTVIVVEPVPSWSAEVGRDDPAFAALASRLARAATVVASPAEVTAALPPPRFEPLEVGAPVATGVDDGGPDSAARALMNRAQRPKGQWRTVGDLPLLVATGSGTARLRGLAATRPERWDIRTGAVEAYPATVDGDDLVVELEGHGTILTFPPGEPVRPVAVRHEVVELPDVWECEYPPWGENRWGDYRLPANEGTPPVERRTFAWREGDGEGWHRAPVVPEDVQQPLFELGFEDRMGGANGRVAPAERWIADGWREVVSTYGAKAVVERPDGAVELAEYSERLGIEDAVLTTAIGLKGWVEPYKVDLGEAGSGRVRSFGHVPDACETHLVVEGRGVVTVSLDGRHLCGPVELGVLSIPVTLAAGWHEVVVDAAPREVADHPTRAYRPLPRTRLSWAFTEPYHRAPVALWGGAVMHPEYKGAPGARRFRRRITLPEAATVRVAHAAPAPVHFDVPEVLPAGDHVLEALVGSSLVAQSFTAEIECTFASGAVATIGSDTLWETSAPGEPWVGSFEVGMAGAISWSKGDTDLGEPPRRSPLLDVAWLEGDDVLAGHADDAWSDAAEPPPPSWFCFTAPPGARSMTLPVVGDVQAWVDGEPVDGAAAGGSLPLREHARVALRVQAPTGRRGAACFTEHPILDVGAGTIRVGRSWHRQGLDAFSGVVLLRTTVDVDGATDAVLDLGEVSGSVEVRVNGEVAGVLAWAPWRIPVTLRAGRNVVELEVANTLGPLAGRGIPTPFGPEDQRITGILGRPRLLVPDEGARP